MKIERPADLRMNEKLFVPIAAALQAAEFHEEEVIAIARAMYDGGIRTLEVFLRASEAQLLAAKVPPGALVAFEAVRAAAAQASPDAEPDEGFAKMKPRALLGALARGEKRPEAIEAAGKKLKFLLASVNPDTGEQRVDAEATWDLMVALLDEGEDRPAGKTYKGFAVIEPKDLVAPRKARWLSPWDGKPLSAGEDEAGIGWRTEDALKGPSAQAFVRFVRTRVRPELVPAKDAFAMASAMRAAGGDYRNLAKADPNWRKAVDEYENERGRAAREGRNLQDELLAELVRREEGATASEGSSTATEEKITPQAIAEALQDAFPTWEKLRLMAWYELSLRLENIVRRSDDVAKASTALVKYFQRQNALEVLVRGAYRADVSNPKLQACLNAFPAPEPKAAPSNELTFTSGNGLKKALCGVGALLYPSERSAQRVANHAGLKTESIDFRGNSLDMWGAVIDEAIKTKGGLAALIREMLEEYPDDNILVAAGKEAPLYFA